MSRHGFKTQPAPRGVPPASGQPQARAIRP